MGQLVDIAAYANHEIKSPLSYAGEIINYDITARAEEAVRKSKLPPLYTCQGSFFGLDKALFPAMCIFSRNPDLTDLMLVDHPDPAA
jgi:hypothetical protein